MKKTKHLLLVFVIIALALRLTQMATASLFDPSESRYATLGKNMAESGDYVTPRFYHKDVYQSFDGKPPLYFQAAGVACKLLPQNMTFATRLPAFLSGLIVLLMLGFTVKQFAGISAAKRAVFYCFTTVMFYAMMGIAMTDMMLTMAVSCSLMCYALFDKTLQKRYSIAVFAFLAIGMMVKGPVALALFGLPVVLYTAIFKRWSTLKSHAWLVGPAIFLAITLPWYVIKAKEGPNFLYYFFVNENFLRFVTHDYGDRYGSGRETFRGMAMVWFFVATLPWFPLIVWPAWKKRLAIFREPLVGFLAVGCLGIIGFWCLTSRVPLAYLLPAVPLFMGVIALQPVPEKIQRWIPIVGMVGIFGLCIVLTQASRFGKMPQGVFQKVMRDYPQMEGVAFTHSTPYSADFYMGNNVKHAVKDATPYYLFSKKKYAHEVSGRTKLLEMDGWVFFAPPKQTPPAKP